MPAKRKQDLRVAANRRNKFSHFPFITLLTVAAVVH
jgi:hypothetical protein